MIGPYRAVIGSDAPLLEPEKRHTFDRSGEPSAHESA